MAGDLHQTIVVVFMLLVAIVVLAAWATRLRIGESSDMYRIDERKPRFLVKRTPIG